MYPQHEDTEVTPHAFATDTALDSVGAMADAIDAPVQAPRDGSASSVSAAAASVSAKQAAATEAGKSPGRVIDLRSMTYGQRAIVLTAGGQLIATTLVIALWAIPQVSVPDTAQVPIGAFLLGVLSLIVASCFILTGALHSHWLSRLLILGVFTLVMAIEPARELETSARPVAVFQVSLIALLWLWALVIWSAERWVSRRPDAQVASLRRWRGLAVSAARRVFAGDFPVTTFLLVLFILMSYYYALTVRTPSTPSPPSAVFLQVVLFSQLLIPVLFLFGTDFAELGQQSADRLGGWMTRKINRRVTRRTALTLLTGALAALSLVIAIRTLQAALTPSTVTNPSALVFAWLFAICGLLYIMICTPLSCALGVRLAHLDLTPSRVRVPIAAPVVTAVAIMGSLVISYMATTLIPRLSEVVTPTSSGALVDVGALGLVLTVCLPFVVALLVGAPALLYCRHHLHARLQAKPHTRGTTGRLEERIGVAGLYLVVVAVQGPAFLILYCAQLAAAWARDQTPFAVAQELEWAFAESSLHLSVVQIAVAAVTLAVLLSNSLWRRQGARASRLMRPLLVLNGGLLFIAAIYYLFSFGQSSAEKLNFAQAGVLLLALGWDIATSGEAITNRTGVIFTRHVRLLLYFGFTMLVCTAVLYLSHHGGALGSQGDAGGAPVGVVPAFSFSSEVWPQIGLVYLGIPLLLVSCMVEIMRRQGHGATTDERRHAVLDGDDRLARDPMFRYGLLYGLSAGLLGFIPALCFASALAVHAQSVTAEVIYVLLTLPTFLASLILYFLASQATTRATRSQWRGVAGGLIALAVAGVIYVGVRGVLAFITGQTLWLLAMSATDEQGPFDVSTRLVSAVFTLVYVLILFLAYSVPAIGASLLGSLLTTPGRRSRATAQAAGGTQLAGTLPPPMSTGNSSMEVTAALPVGVPPLTARSPFPLTTPSTAAAAMESETIVQPTMPVRTAARTSLAHTVIDALPGLVSDHDGANTVSRAGIRVGVLAGGIGLAQITLSVILQVAGLPGGASDDSGVVLYMLLGLVALLVNVVLFALVALRVSRKTRQPAAGVSAVLIAACVSLLIYAAASAAVAAVGHDPIFTTVDTETAPESLALAAVFMALIVFVPVLGFSVLIGWLIARRAARGRHSPSTEVPVAASLQSQQPTYPTTSESSEAQPGAPPPAPSFGPEGPRPASACPRFCPQGHAIVESHALFCPQCGSRLPGNQGP